MARKIALDPEEREILASFERGEWKTVKNIKQARKKIKSAAKNYIEEKSRVSVQISMGDFLALKQIAAFEGVPPEVLMSSVLHKYAAGHLHTSA